MNIIKIISNECSNWINWTKIYSMMAVVAAITVSTGCSKDKDTKPALEDGRSTVIYDLAGDTEAAMGSTAPGKETRDFYTFLFRFADKRQIWIKTKADSAQWLKSKDWDIAFTGPYNSEIYINNATQQGNPGQGGEANKTAVILLPQSYERLNSAPSDADFDKSSLSKIGWAANSSSQGWFQYSDNTHIMQALPNRSYAIRLPDGKYAKLQLISAYKGNPPAITNLNWPAPYYTFRYYVQADGSKNLNTN